MEVIMKYYNFNEVASVYDQTRSIPQQLVDKFKEDVISFYKRILRRFPTKFFL